MATLDLVNIYGGKPSNFLDLGGGTGQEAMEKALAIYSRALSDGVENFLLGPVIKPVFRKYN